jgi:hypothetical protein
VSDCQSNLILMCSTFTEAQNSSARLAELTEGLSRPARPLVQEALGREWSNIQQRPLFTRVAPEPKRFHLNLLSRRFGEGKRVPKCHMAADARHPRAGSPVRL